MPRFEKAPLEVMQLVDRLMEKKFGHLVDHGVTVDLLMAHATTDKNGDPVGVALKLHGRQCAATVKIVNYKLRVQGHADAEITLDGDRWDEWSQRQQEAILHHELYHLEPVMADTPTGSVLQRDDFGRPRLRLRRHDHDFGWFNATAREYGEDSIEVQQARELLESHSDRQLYFSWFEDAGSSRPAKAAARRVHTRDGRVLTPGEAMVEIGKKLKEKSSRGKAAAAR